MDRGQRPDADGSVRVIDSESIDDVIDGYLVPIDPMDLVQCESCQ
jgi:hypothetical protein